jgi:hypothetical protein
MRLTSCPHNPPATSGRSALRTLKRYSQGSVGWTAAVSGLRDCNRVRTSCFPRCVSPRNCAGSVPRFGQQPGCEDHQLHVGSRVCALSEAIGLRHGGLHVLCGLRLVLVSREGRHDRHEHQLLVSVSGPGQRRVLGCGGLVVVLRYEGALWCPARVVSGPGVF